jgi:hypothetical protein
MKIEESVRYVRKSCTFASQADKAIALGRFETARKIYGKLL